MKNKFSRWLQEELKKHLGSVELSLSFVQERHLFNYFIRKRKRNLKRFLKEWLNGCRQKFTEYLSGIILKGSFRQWILG